MQIGFNLNNIDYKMSDSLLRNLMDNDAELYDFSVFERFVDFFKYLFTGNSTISDYRAIYEILYPHHSTVKISDPLSLRSWGRGFYDPTEWRTVVGFVRLIEQSKSDVISRYSIVENKLDEETSLLKMRVDGILIAEAICSERNLLFLKEYLFNENNSEIILTKEMDCFQKQEGGQYLHFEDLLKKHLSAQMKTENVINNDPHVGDIKDEIGKKDEHYASGVGFKLAFSANSALINRALSVNRK
ncbi:hypothetical protein [Lonsdalea quercina]|uniref:hypothetical protein n=1 Tax=Lonsdalea quercina TaxID=71657 RepID=UPI003974986C